MLNVTCVCVVEFLLMTCVVLTEGYAALDLGGSAVEYAAPDLCSFNCRDATHVT
jgi:hypothetical protein